MIPTPPGIIIDALMAVEVAARRLGRQGALDSLLPGISSDEATARLASVGLAARLALRTMWSWRDGTSVENRSLDDIQLFPGFYMLSSSEATDSYRAFRDDGRWHPSWLPIFANGGGDFYYVVMTCFDGPVGHFRIDELDHPIEFGTLADFLTTLAAAYQERIFYVDNRGYLEMQDEKFATLAGRLNPEIDWWKYITPTTAANDDCVIPR